MLRRLFPQEILTEHPSLAGIPLLTAKCDQPVRLGAQPITL